MSVLRWMGLWAVFAVVLGGPPTAAAVEREGGHRASEALLQAIERGDEDEVARQISERADVNGRDRYGATPLMWAAQRHSQDLVRRLLVAGADPNRADNAGLTPLHVAVMNRESGMALLLLAKGANANARRDTGETVLMAAARTGQFEVMEDLVRRGADVNAHENEFHQTALMWSAGHPDQVKLLIGHRADVHARTKTWQIKYPIFPIHDPGAIGRPTKFYASSMGGQSALFFAVQANDLSSVKALLDAGEDVNRRASDGTTALLLALLKWDGSAKSGEVRYGISAPLVPLDPQVGIATLLLDAGARADFGNSAGYTPLHAAVLGMVPTRHFGAKDLIGRSSDGGARGAIANPEEGLALVSRLLRLKADPQAVTRYPMPGPIGKVVALNPTPPGSTALHIAALAAEPRLIELLVANGADPNRLNSVGHSALSIAVAANDLPVVQALVARGGDVRRVYSPAEYLASGPAPSQALTSLVAPTITDPVARAIAVAGLLKWRPRADQTLMHIAAAARAHDIVKFLAEQGASVDVPNSEGETPLLLADNQEYLDYSNRITIADTQNMDKSEAELKSYLEDMNRDTTTSDALRQVLATQRAHSG